MAEQFFQLRMVQLDLARQMESIDFIKRFIDLAQESSYNAVLMYVEGRIKTASVPFFPDDQTYSESEMRDVAAYAAKKEIELIPCVSTLGHAELFLKYPELADLSETRGNVPGRFAMTQNVFCPSQDKLWTFLGKYLAEICDIFPSKYFHAGCDETFDLGVCEICRKGNYADLYVNHIEKSREVLRKLGRRMMIWDDMFEFFPEKLKTLSKDIIMVNWNYDDTIRGYRGHFCNSRFYDTLQEYEKLGFEVIIAPSDYTYQNIANFCRYAWRGRALGALVTTWEKSSCLLTQSLPAIYAGGKCLASPVGSDTEAIFTAAMRDLFMTDDAVTLSALRTFCATGLFYERHNTLSSCLTRPHQMVPEFPVASDRQILAALEKFAPSRNADVIADIKLSLRSRLLAAKFGSVIYDYFQLPGEREFLAGKLQAARAELLKQSAARQELWQAVRPGIDMESYTKLYADYLGEMSSVESQASRHGTLEVVFCLPEQYSAPKVRIWIKYANEDAWTNIAEGVYKNDDTRVAYYDRLFLIDPVKQPEYIKLDEFWYGLQGFAFLSLRNNSGEYIPESIIDADGKVFEPWQILKNDLQFTLLGSQDPVPAALDKSKAEVVSSLTLRLKKS